MMNLTNEKRMEALRNAGIDADKYNLTEVIILEPKANDVVEDKQIDNKKLFRRWVTAQTFRMLNNGSRNSRGVLEYGWDAYLRNNYAYKYQFTMMLEELRVLSKLEVRDKEAFDERSNFFTRDVVVATCNDYIHKVKQLANANASTVSKTNKGKFKNTVINTTMVKMPRNPEMKMSDFIERYVDKPNELINELQMAKTYAEMYTLLKLFIKSMFELPGNTAKCSEWKTAFKGIGAYETLKNMILFHDVKLNGCANKDESMERLTECLDKYRGEYWRFHYMLKETIEINNFNLRESINGNK